LYYEYKEGTPIFIRPVEKWKPVFLSFIDDSFHHHDYRLQDKQMNITDNLHTREQKAIMRQ
jgi:hypothetical protein